MESLVIDSNQRALLDAVGHVFQDSGARGEITLMVTDLQVIRLQLVDEGVSPLVISVAVADKDVVMLTIPQCGRNE